MSLYDMQNWATSTFPNGKWENAQHTDWLISSPLREDKHPSFSINLEKRVCYDRATNETYLISEICQKLGLNEPDRKGEEASYTPPATVNKNSLIALERWNKAQPATDDFPYLLRKGVPSLGLRTDLDQQMGQVILIPALDTNGKVVGIERINGEGQKQHLGEKKNSFFLIVKPPLEGERIYIAEGYATACSIHQITARPVAISFSAFNLPNVAKIMRDNGYLPIICTDAGASLVPDFRNVQTPEGTPKGQDWNDIAQEHGLDRARELFREAEAKSTEPIPPAISKETLLFEAIETPSPETASIPDKVWHFPRKHLNLLASDSGMGKSILLTKVACDLSLGLPVLEGRYEARRKILYLNGECGKDYFNWRFRASGWSYSAENFKVVHQETLAEKSISLDFDTLQGRKYLELLLSAEKPDLLIIDSCPAFSDSDQNDGQKQNEIAKYLKGLAIQHKLALVLVTHLRKRRLQDEESEPTLSEIQGSNAPAKIANLILVLYEKNIEHDGEFKKIKVCKSVKSWGVPVKPFGYEMPDYGENRLVINPVEIPKKGRTKNSWEVVVEALGDSEFTRQDLEVLLGVSDKTVKKCLTEWYQQGKITRRGSGKNTVYLVSNGQTTPTPSITSPNVENPVIPTRDSGKPFFPESDIESPPIERNHSGKLGFPESNPVIPITYKDSGKYIDNGGTQEEAPLPSGEYSEAEAREWLKTNPEARRMYQQKRDRMMQTIKDKQHCFRVALKRTWEHFHK